MSHPERRGGEVIIPIWTELHSAQVCEAISITYRQLENWIIMGLVDVESFRQGTHIPFAGSGSFRVYRYHHILELSLVREIHQHRKSLESIKEMLATPPEGSDSWGGAISQYNPPESTGIFCAGYTEDDPLDLITDPKELLGLFASSASGVCINLAQLKSETDAGIRRVLSTGG